MQTKPEDVCTFWFETLTPSQWWTKDPNLDKTIADRFSLLHQQAALGELYSWRTTPHGRLAEIVVLDQFSRNIFRNTAQAFAYDSIALVLAQETVANGMHEQLSAIERSFVYLPYMHSESQIVHEQALILFEKNGIDNNIHFELEHKAIIDRFGRYPHRNDILGRQSTMEELEFLKTHQGF